MLASILELVRSARPGSSHDARVNQHVAWGPGPRAGQALMLAVRARALLRGRLAPAVDDVAEHTAEGSVTISQSTWQKILRVEMELARFHYKIGHPE